MESSPKIRPARVERALAAVVMAALTLITGANVLMRYCTNISFAMTEEVSVFLLLILTLVGSISAFVEGRHVRITLVVDSLPAWGRTACAALEWISNVAMFSLLAWFGALAAWDDYSFEVTSPSLGLPQWWYSVWLPVCSALVVLRLALMLVARRRAA
ncbi:MAG: TRAP transporter small permease [Deltaproteobacteria bacterium]|nr:TRAP transporter small permease [Deltaproteobacteria bacterium]